MLHLKSTLKQLNINKAYNKILRTEQRSNIEKDKQKN